MSKTNTPPPPSSSSVWMFLQDRIAPFLVALYQGMIIVAFAALAILAYRWVHTPFIGAFIEHTLIFNAMGP
ncbi:MAG: hypothetical protein ABIG63_10735, partial [Chloroflexota bacterium]